MEEHNVGDKVVFPSIQSVNIFVNSTKHIGKGSKVGIGGNNFLVVDVISDTEIEICPATVEGK